MADKKEAAKVKAKNKKKKGKCKDPTGKKTEIKMHKHYARKGYRLISKHRVPQGIDGVYESMTGGSPKYIIGEAKFGSSGLGRTVDTNKQMSKNWIDKRLGQQLTEDQARAVRKGYKPEVFHVDHKCQKSIKKLKQIGNSGAKIGKATKIR